MLVGEFSESFCHIQQTGFVIRREGRRGGSLTGHSTVYDFTPRIDFGAQQKGSAMFALVPLDVWVAAALAAAIGLVAIFGPSAGVFVLIYFCLCAYIIIEVISDEVA